jgi:hypothetical protein
MDRQHQRVTPPVADCGSQRLATQLHAAMSTNPQIEDIPLRAHSACTAAGSVGLSLLTQAGIMPQQLPTFLTAQSASALQL